MYHQTMLWMLLALALAAGPGPIQAESHHQVRDGAALFSPEAVAAANRAIEQIHKRYGLDVLIETLPRLPADIQAKMDAAPKVALASRVFTAYTRRRAEEQGVNGIYVLLCTSPRVIAVVPWPEQESKVFSARNCNQVRRCFTDGANVNRPNEALLEMVDEIQDLLRSNLASDAPYWGTIIGVFLGVGVVWSFALLLRRWIMTRQKQPRPAQPEDKPNPTLPVIVGGMVGTPTGQWIYDNSPQPHKAELPAPPPGTIPSSRATVQTADDDAPDHDGDDEDDHPGSNSGR